MGIKLDMLIAIQTALWHQKHMFYNEISIYIYKQIDIGIVGVFHIHVELLICYNIHSLN